MNDIIVNQNIFVMHIAFFCYFSNYAYNFKQGHPSKNSKNINLISHLWCHNFLPYYCGNARMCMVSFQTQ